MIDLRELIQKISQAKDKLELQNIKSQFLGKNSQINQEFKKLYLHRNLFHFFCYKFCLNFFGHNI